MEKVTENGGKVPNPEALGRNSFVTSIAFRFALPRSFLAAVLLPGPPD